MIDLDREICGSGKVLGMQTKPLWAVALVSLLVVSCDSDKDKAKIAEIQKQADDRISQIQREAQEKVAAAEKRSQTPTS